MASVTMRPTAKTYKKPAKAKAKPKPKKQKTPAQLSQVLAILIQKLVRLKAADDKGYVTCVTCGVIRLWNDGMQGGHFISRVCAATRVMEENIHPQCACCNGPKRGNMIEYTIFMLGMYGDEFVHELRQLQKASGFKWCRQDLEDQIIEVRQQIKEQEVRLGI